MGGGPDLTLRGVDKKRTGACTPAPRPCYASLYVYSLVSLFTIHLPILAPDDDAMPCLPLL